MNWDVFINWTNQNGTWLMLVTFTLFFAIYGILIWQTTGSKRAGIILAIGPYIAWMLCWYFVKPALGI